VSHAAVKSFVSCKNARTCSLSVLRSCFYHAERVLSAIAKFLVHLFGERRGEMGKVRGRGREWG